MSARAGLAAVLLPMLIAAAAPAGAAPGLFGLNGLSFLHYRDAPDARSTAAARMAVLKRAGATWDRFDLWWDVVEPRKGAWRWDQTDWLIRTYARSGVRMLPILCYAAAWMQRSPHTPDDFRDYAAYVHRVVSRYRDRVHCWEVWNEPNIPTFWKPEPDVEAYTRLLKAAYDAAHRADPGCVVVGAAANETDVNWLEGIARRGGLRYMDAVSIHPYSMSDGPEEMDLARQIRNVRAFLRANGRPGLPIWITEMGWVSDAADPVSMRAAGRYMAQSYVIAAAEGVERLFWFNLQDWREGAKLEGWGLISPEGKPKATLTAYRRLVSLLADARFAGYLPVAGGAGFLFRGKRGSVAAAWCRRGARTRLFVGARARAADAFGEPVPVTNGAIPVTDAPVFIQDPSPVLVGLAAPQPPPGRRNLVVNGDLALDDAQGGPYGWGRGMFYGGADKGTFAVDGAGRQRALVLGPSEDAFWQSFPVYVLPGERYRLTAEVDAREATGENGVQILFLSGPGWGWKGGPVSPSVTGSSGGWKNVSVVGTVPTDADVIRVNLVSKANRGRVAFRNIRLTQERP